MRYADQPSLSRKLRMCKGATLCVAVRVRCDVEDREYKGENHYSVVAAGCTIRLATYICSRKGLCRGEAAFLRE
jgi:hypothetical protein